jgi:hypothetical protein
MIIQIEISLLVAYAVRTRLIKPRLVATQNKVTSRRERSTSIQRYVPIGCGVVDLVFPKGEWENVGRIEQLDIFGIFCAFRDRIWKDFEYHEIRWRHGRRHARNQSWAT